MNYFEYTLGFGEKRIPFYTLNIVRCISTRCQYYQLRALRENSNVHIFVLHKSAFRFIYSLFILFNLFPLKTFLKFKTKKYFKKLFPLKKFF